MSLVTPLYVLRSNSATFDFTFHVFHGRQNRVPGKSIIFGIKSV